jgi:predicted RND superfamily exporter protein
MSCQTQQMNPVPTDPNDPVKTNALKEFLGTEKDKLLQQIDDQKKASFDQVYGNLLNASEANIAMIASSQENKRMYDIEQNILAEKNKSVQDITKDITEDKNLAKRKYEMNEWSVQNKKETLFIYSMFLILISGIVLLSALLNMDIISSYLFTSLIIPFIIIFLLVVIYRARLTSVYRNKRYWNRRQFDEKSGRLKIPTFAICPPANTESGQTTNSSM